MNRMLTVLSLSLAMSASLLPGLSAAQGPMEHHHPMAGMAHPEMRGADAAFHDLMEPLWHVADRAEQVKNACSSVKDIKMRVDAMVHEHGSTALMKKMRKSAGQLAGACKNDKTEIVASGLDALHQEFHELMGMN